MSQENVYKKLQTVRYKLSQEKMKKSGKAKGKDGKVRYDYFELSDFLPKIEELCFNEGIAPIYNFGDLKATLKIVNLDNPNDYIVFSMPVKVSQLLMCNDMQNIGGAKTFAKRYLYFDAFEIAENDETEVRSTQPGALEKINSVQLKVIKQLIQETNTDEFQFMTWCKVDDLKEITVGKLPSVMAALNKKKEQQKVEKTGK